LLTVRSYKPEVREHLLSGIARIARGEAIAAGMPEDRMPVMVVKDESATSTFNTPTQTARLGALFAARFGEKRVVASPPAMASEDFSNYWLADPKIESTIFWVGGVTQARFDAAKGDPTQLPSLHSPFWAPDAEAVIATAAEALAAAAIDTLAK